MVNIDTYTCTLFNTFNIISCMLMWRTVS